MRYSKPALSFSEQAQRLLDRGLVIPNRALLEARLKSVNYYRLSAYWYPFLRSTPEGERFVPNTQFETIWRRYSFDRELRLLVLEALERVEVAILRTRMVEQFTVKYGPFGYSDIENFRDDFKPKFHRRLLSEIEDSVNRSKEEFVARFRDKYTSERRLPLWMAAEVMTFGQLFTFYRQLHYSEAKTLARQFGVFPPVMNSWLHTLNFVRNTCAHHGRLWNRELPIKPRVPRRKNNPEWHHPDVSFSNRRVFIVLTILHHLLAHIAPDSGWRGRLETLFDANPDIPLQMMGFPTNWGELLIWRRTS